MDNVIVLFQVFVHLLAFLVMGMFLFFVVGGAIFTTFVKVLDAINGN